MARTAECQAIKGMLIGQRELCRCADNIGIRGRAKRLSSMLSGFAETLGHHLGYAVSLALRRHATRVEVIVFT